ncbi:MAG: LysR family transcriptional regulator, partial [Acetatifactor sp.]|nr:LysR family transcriptional regulator [Acetatifactor sp.]
MIDNLEYFKVFYHVAKAGSVTGAARELAVSQPAVSQAIRQLESQLGADLFYRAAKGVRLTREGQLLFSYVEKGYEQIEQGLEKLLRLQNMEGG